MLELLNQTDIFKEIIQKLQNKSNLSANDKLIAEQIENKKHTEETKQNEKIEQQGVVINLSKDKSEVDSDYETY